MDFDGCTFGDWRSAKHRILVVGNSTSIAEIGMVQPLAGPDQSFTVTASWGAAPAGGIPAAAEWAAASEDYWGRVVPALIGRLRPGDVILMISDLSTYAPARPSPLAQRSVETLVARLDVFAREMDEKSVAVIFQSVLPFMRETGCTPQSSVSPWSLPGSVENPACSFLTRAATIERRAPLHEALVGVQARHGNFRVLDLLPVLCPGTVCGYTAPDGTFLFRDEHGHPSIEGAAASSDALRRILDALSS